MRVQKTRAQNNITRDVRDKKKESLCKKTHLTHTTFETRKTREANSPQVPHVSSGQQAISLESLDRLLALSYSFIHKNCEANIFKNHGPREAHWTGTSACKIKAPQISSRAAGKSSRTAPSKQYTGHHTSRGTRNNHLAGGD